MFRNDIFDHTVYNLRIKVKVSQKPGQIQVFYKHDTRFFFIRKLKFKKVCIIMFGSMLLAFISNRMISSAINEKIKEYKIKES